METNKIWGFILIGVGVLLALWGIGSLYTAFSYSSQMSAVGGMLGGEMSQLAGSLAPSKVPGFILLVLGGTSAFFGTKLLKKTEANK